MSSPIYVSGSATITPPVSPATVLTLPDSGDWLVDDDGATLRFAPQGEGRARRYDDDLEDIVARIHECGSVVTGSFRWETEEECGKTVITEGEVVEYVGFRAYSDGTTEDGRLFAFLSKEA